MRGEVRQHQELAALAEAQHGVVSMGQLLALGYSKGSVARGTTAGRLHRLHRGVYAVGHRAVSRHGTCLAATFACGKGALISHNAAAWLWGLEPGWPSRIDITTPRRGHIRSELRLHHSTILEEADLGLCHGVPTTAVPRTLLDRAAALPSRRLRGLLEKAERMAVLDIGAIDSLLARGGSHKGRKRLMAALALYRPPVMSRADTERAFLALVRDEGLPLPAINTTVAGHEIDAYWDQLRFAIELDGYETHRTRAAFERDRIRVEDLKLVGVDLIRVSARRIEWEPARVAKRVRALLEQRQQELRRH